MWTTASFPTAKVPTTYFPYSIEIDSEPKPPARNLLEKLEKVVIETLKFLGGLLKLAGVTTVGEWLKSTEVTLNWVLMNQDLFAGRIANHLNSCGFSIKHLREFVGAAREAIQLAAIPCGMVAAYAAQIAETGKVTGFVYPFSKVVVRTFSLEARILLLMREVLVFAEQLKTRNPDYIRMAVAATLTASLALTFLQYTVAAIVFTVAKEIVVIGNFVLRYGQHTLTKWHVGQEGLKIEQQAIQLRQDFYSTMELGFHSLYKEIADDKALQQRLEDKFFELHRALYKAPNEHVMLNVIDSYIHFLKGMKAASETIESAQGHRELCRRASEEARRREQHALEHLEKHKAFLEHKILELRDWSKAVNTLPPTSQLALQKSMDIAVRTHRELNNEVYQLGLRRLSMWSMRTDGTKELKRYVPILERERVLLEAEQLSKGSRRASIVDKIRSIYRERLKNL